MPKPLKPSTPSHLDSVVNKKVREFHKANSDQALQAAIELMLFDRNIKEVVASLKTWIDYLEERK